MLKTKVIKKKPEQLVCGCRTWKVRCVRCGKLYCPSCGEKDVVDPLDFSEVPQLKYVCKKCRAPAPPKTKEVIPPEERAPRIVEAKEDRELTEDRVEW